MNIDLIKLYISKNNDNLINELYNNINIIIETSHKLLKNIPFKDSKKYNLFYSIKKSLDFTNRKNIFSDENLLQIYQYLILNLLHINSEINLESNKEINDIDSNISYRILICDNDKKKKLFLLYVVLYYFESNICSLRYNNDDINNSMFVGIDYEFNNRKIALMQINYERLCSPSLETSSHIFIINPGEFDTKESDILITYLMRCKLLYKILHGCDSLDLPYMYDILFDSNIQIIKDFTSTVYDTRFFCEYYKNTVDEDKKCSIYDALKFFDVIDKNKFEELNNTHDYMGPVQDINWSIYKMSSHHKKYALYDVLFLKHFLFKIYKKAYTITPKYYKSYLIIPALTRLIFMEKKEVTNIIKKSKSDIDIIHNYLIKYNNQNFTLIKIYNDIIQDIFIDDWGLKLDNILLINYFRSGLIIIIKKIVYYIIIKKMTVYINKQKTMNNNLNIDELFDTINDTKEYMRLHGFLKSLYNKIKLKLELKFNLL